MRSECCGALAYSSIEDGIGICSDCKEWSEFKEDDDYISGIEVPLKNHWGYPIASFNPQYRNGKIRSALEIKRKNFKRVKTYFDVDDTGYGQLNFTNMTKKQ